MGNIISIPRLFEILEYNNYNFILQDFLFLQVT
jgi:hypothetical protein